jgi:hypothetical protein
MPTQKYTRMTYQSASELWHRYEDKNRAHGYVKVAPNTKLIQIAPFFDDKDVWQRSTYVIRFHNTDIITFFSDESFVLNHSGFMTNTTKARMNQFAPVRVFQSKGEWYVTSELTKITSKFNGNATALDC